MMLEPEVNESPISTNRNSSLDQSTISAPSRERCIEQVAAAPRKSSTKSRLETASSEFCATELKPSSSAIDALLVSQFTPASAPAPSCSAPVDRRQNAKRSRSRLNIQKYASR